MSTPSPTLPRKRERGTAEGAARPRHRWGDPARFAYKTERACQRCDVIKVTRHEPDRFPWAEFWRDGLRIVGARTPPCEGAALPQGICVTHTPGAA